MTRSTTYLKKLRRLLYAQTCVALLATTSWGQTATAKKTSQSDQTQPAKPVPVEKVSANATNNNDNGGVLTLSPFEVKSSKATGYYTPNTLAGTRLNNKISDLASSITIVTKQEMLDTDSTNINDVFRYEANTEGASTYTPIALVRGNAADVLGTRLLTGGNRVRGLASADLQVDNFFSLHEIPFDSYNTASLEVDRGPNSILFGTGSPAGIVNQSRDKAEVDKRSGNVSLQASSYGGYRDTFNYNIPLIKNKLAVRVAQAYTSRGFKQKPSSDITRREYAAFTFIPFSSGKTKLVGSFEYYNRFANDPNGITPVDFVTPWRQNGRPSWDPTTSTVTYLNGGQVVGPYTPSTDSAGYVGYLQKNLTNKNSSQFIPTLNYVSTGGHIVRGINPDGSTTPFYKSVQHGFTDNPVPPAATITPAQEAVNSELMTMSTGTPYPAGYQIWQFPGVTSKSVYDWSKVNINAMNRTQSSAKTYYAELTQQLLPNLHLDLGWFRQEYKDHADNPVSQANATTIYVDTNSKLMDGSINPHFGQAFLDTYESDQFIDRYTNNNLRASLEYEFNLKKHLPDWLGWLGHHRLMFVASQHEVTADNLRYREAIMGGDPNYLPSAATFNRDAGYGYARHNVAIEQWFYLNGNGSANAAGTSAPGSNARPPIAASASDPYEVGTVNTYIYNFSQWETSQFHMQSLLYPTGGLSQNVQDGKTYFWQGFLWNNRIVATVGLNQEKIKNRANVFPHHNPESYEYTNGYANMQYWRNYGSWAYDSGRTWTKGVVVHPFQHWARIDEAANNGNLLAGVARTLSFTFNDSANFNPPPAHYTDFFGNNLGQPSGKERDYGIEISTPDHKFYLRATWFKTSNLNQLIGNTSNGRAVYVDHELQHWATVVTEIRDGQDPSSPDFGNTNIYPITSAMQDQISKLTGLPYDFGGNVGPNGQYVNPHETENGIAKGIELEAIWNPTPNWRLKFTWGKQRTITSNIASQAAAWVAYRLPQWQKYTAPDLAATYTLSNGRVMSLQNFWDAYGYHGSEIYPGQAYGWNDTKSYYNTVVAPQLAFDTALNNTQATNQRVYSWSLVSSYDFTNGPMKNWTVGGAVRYLGRALAGYYGDTTNVNLSGQIYKPDISKPIYYPHQYHLDAWLAYHFKLPMSNGRIHASVQLNVSDIGIHSHLEPVTYNFDGSPAAERIVMPTSYALTTRFYF